MTNDNLISYQWLKSVQKLPQNSGLRKVNLEMPIQMKCMFDNKYCV